MISHTNIYQIDDNVKESFYYITLALSLTVSLVFLTNLYTEITKYDNLYLNDSLEVNDSAKTLAEPIESAESIKPTDQINWPYLYDQKVNSKIPVDLGDRMKYYETMSKSVVNIDPKLPFAIRLDGRGFSKLTKSFKQYAKQHYDIPYSPEFKRAMILTTHDILHEYSASLGYTHSDEITIVFSGRAIEGSEHIFSGKVQKILTTMSSFATARFIYYIDNEMNNLKKIMDDQTDLTNSTNSIDSTNSYNVMTHLKKPASITTTPTFDARLIVFPFEKSHEIANLLLWRSRGDSSRNFVAMFAETYIGKKELLKMKTEERVRELVNVGFEGFTPNNENLDNSMKFGIFMKRFERSENISKTINKKDKSNMEDNSNISTNFYVFTNLKFSQKFVNFVLEPKGYDNIFDKEESKDIGLKKYDISNVMTLMYHVPDYKKKATDI